MKQHLKEDVNILPQLDKACGLDMHKDKIVSFIPVRRQPPRLVPRERRGNLFFLNAFHSNKAIFIYSRRLVIGSKCL
jgi:hypothetical protein